MVFDQSIYCKFQTLRFGNLELEKRFAVRLGEFHTTMSWLAVIGKRYDSAGLGDILIESGVLASGSSTGVFDGKHYNRALRCHRIASEAFHYLLTTCFFETIDGDDLSSTFNEAMQHLNDFYEKCLIYN